MSGKTYEFTPMNEVPVLESLTEQAHVYVEEGGQTLRVPAKELGSKCFIFEIDHVADAGEPVEGIDGAVYTKNYDPLYEALMRGDRVMIKQMNRTSVPVYLIPRMFALIPAELGASHAGLELDDGEFLFINGSYHSTPESSDE